MDESKEEPKETVSVIIPVYNDPGFLREALRSVLAQERANVEIIVVDDGSDVSLESLTKEYPSCVCLRQAHRGSAAARNLGISQANGEFLAFLDADDLWTDHKLALQLQALQDNPMIHLVAGHVEEFYTSTATFNPQRSQRGYGRRAYTIGAILIRRQDFLRVGWLDEGLQFGEFLDWHSRAMAFGIQPHILDGVVLRRRIHDRNSTITAGTRTSDYLKTIRAHLKRKTQAAMADHQER